MIGLNIIDKTISVISPKAGYRRQGWRNALERSNYDAADYRNANRNWKVLNDSAQNTDYAERDTIRARARDLERNSDSANAITRAYRRNVIGKGFTLQSRTNDEKFNEEAEELWKEWCKAKNCDVTGQQSFNQLMRMALDRKKIDGGMLIKKCYTPGGLVPFKLQALEVDELDATQIRPRKKENKVVGGIEYNEFNRPVGYWIKQYSIDGMTYKEPAYLDSKDVIFYWQKKRPSQIREISDMTPTIERIRDTNEFVKAVSIKERVAACLAVFIKRITPGGNGFMPGRPVVSDKDRESYDGKTLTPGMIAELNPGDEIDVVNPGNSGEDSTTFLKLQQRMTSAGQGLSYEAVSRDMSETNYSSARQANIEDENTFFEESELLQERVMDEIYETFIVSGILSGLLTAKGFWENKRNYLKHQWVSSPKKWIDPAKEANANKIALQTGQKTWQEICAENGKDWQEALIDMAKAMKFAEEQGIDLGGILYGWKKETTTAKQG